jgi:hypothetical protein
VAPPNLEPRVGTVRCGFAISLSASALKIVLAEQPIAFATAWIDTYFTPSSSVMVL